MNREKIEEFILKLKNPQVYSGKEINVVKGSFQKEKINICLVFPDTYEIGMSHQGMKILYHLLSGIDDVNVERSFLPDKESIVVFKEEKIELFSLETKTPLSRFDLVGFSVLSELSCTNILQVLELSNIPLYSNDRGENYPIIAAGGITAAANPEPMRDFIDIFAIGDGEIIFPEIVKSIKKEKGKKRWNPENYSNIPGLYVPSMFNVEKHGRFLVADTGGRKIRKEVMNSLKSNPFRDGLIVPITNVIFDRLEIEIARGCPQNCRFCQAKSYYSPYRAKLSTDIMSELSDSLERTGFESFSLSSLSSGDHPLIEDILDRIVNTNRPCLSISLPSLRPSTLTGSVLNAISTGRKSGITIVPEAGSERLRKVINKDVSDEDIFEAVRAAISYGWQKIKLYFMIGLPTETDEDLEATIELVKKIQNESRQLGKNLKIHISFSPFVPKPHTVFQWAKRDSNEEIFRKTRILLDGLKKYRNMDLDFHRPEKGLVETIISRGDSSVGELIYRAFRSGEIFSAWDSEFNYGVWENHISDLNMWGFLEELDMNEFLPWHFLDFNFKQEYLSTEYKKALNEGTTPSCSDMVCSECQGCSFMYKKEVPRDDPDKAPEPAKKSADGFNKVRLFYTKEGEFSWFSHLPMMKYLERIIRRSGMSFRCTEGFHPRIKMGSIPPLPVFAKGEDEVVELFLDDLFTEEEIVEVLRRVSGDFKFNRAWIVNERRNLNKDIKYIHYSIKTSEADSLKDEINSVLIPSDDAEFGADILDLSIDYSERGAERFAKVYKVIDPDKQSTGNLTRRKIVFKD